jgi:hypothetical protein
MGRRRFFRFCSELGVADLLAIREGQALWLETKRPGGRQSIRQKVFEAKARAAGCAYVLVESVSDLEAKLATS